VPLPGFTPFGGGASGGGGGGADALPIMKLLQQLVKTSPTVKEFVKLMETVVAKHSPAKKEQWYNSDFRTLCDTAITVGGELFVSGGGGGAVAVVTVEGLLGEVSAVVARHTNEAPRKLEMIAKISLNRTGSQTTQNTSRSHTGTIKSQTSLPLSATTAASLPTSKKRRREGPAGAALDEAVATAEAVFARRSAELGGKTDGAAPGYTSLAALSHPLGLRQSSGPSLSTLGGLQQKAAAAAAQTTRSPRLSATAMASASAAPALKLPSPSPPPVPQQRMLQPVPQDKIHVFMPWTLPAPTSSGLMLRRVVPKSFRDNGAPLSAAEVALWANAVRCVDTTTAPALGQPSSASDLGGMSQHVDDTVDGVPTVWDLCCGVESPLLLQQWRRRQVAIARRAAPDEEAANTGASDGGGVTDDVPIRKRARDDDDDDDGTDAAATDATQQNGSTPSADGGASAVPRLVFPHSASAVSQGAREVSAQLMAAMTHYGVCDLA
jgi:hypothetical protein